MDASTEMAQSRTASRSTGLWFERGPASGLGNHLGERGGFAGLVMNCPVAREINHQLVVVAVADLVGLYSLLRGLSMLGNE